MNSNTKEKIVNEAQRIEEDSLYSAKGHFYAAQFWESFHLWVGVPTSIIAAIAGTSALNEAHILAGVLAMLVAGLTAIITFVNPNEKANAHHTAGNAYNSLNNDSRIFHDIEAQKADDVELLMKNLNLHQPHSP